MVDQTVRLPESAVEQLHEEGAVVLDEQDRDRTIKYVTYTNDNNDN